jgi:hypothetical protein
MMRFALVPENYEEKQAGSLHSWHFAQNQPVAGFNLMWSEGKRTLPAGIEELSTTEGWRLLGCAPCQENSGKMETTTIKLATIEAGNNNEMMMTIKLEPRGDSRVLVARNEDGSIEEVLNEGQSYADNNQGIVDGCEQILGSYGQSATWQLEMLVDWRDYLPE